MTTDQAQLVHLVSCAPRARAGLVGNFCFKAYDDVPYQAIRMTVIATAQPLVITAWQRI